MVWIFVLWALLFGGAHEDTYHPEEAEAISNILKVDPEVRIGWLTGEGGNCWQIQIDLRPMHSGPCLTKAIVLRTCVIMVDADWLLDWGRLVLLYEDKILLMKKE